MKRALLLGLGAIALVACGHSDDGTAAAAGTSSAAPGELRVTATDIPRIVPAPDVAGQVPTLGITPVEISPAPTLAQPSQAPRRTCMDVKGPEVTDALATLAPFYGPTEWIATSQGDLCEPFSWVQADFMGATVSSPSHILFFGNDVYLGTATAEPKGYTSVGIRTPDVITVDYRWPVGDDANANPSGGPATIRYQWDGTTVTMLDPLPPEVG